MELYIYSETLEQQGVIDSFSSLRWRRRFFEPGEFELHVPATQENLSLLRAGNVLHRLDRQEAGIIESVKISESRDRGSEIEASGRMGSSLLDQRIILPAISFSGTVEDAMRKLVSENAIAARPISFLTLGAQQNFPSSCSFQVSGKNVLSALKALSKSAPLGFRVRLDIPDQKWVFEAYDGKDHTVGQTDTPYVLFSDGFGNIREPGYTLDTTGYRNFAYVVAESDDAVRTIAEVDQTGGETRRELWVDAGDIQKGDLTDDEYRTQLMQRGLIQLAETAKAESFEAAAVNTENFQYLTDWDLGDIVSFEKWELRLDQRITEVEEVYENGVETITPVCGTPLPETLNLGSDT
ncbi:MAG: siphovirus ReqiPepy6 Gp37-like family protein [bacterium]